jgi:hypothetical protein
MNEFSNVTAGLFVGYELLLSFFDSGLSAILKNVAILAAFATLLER